VKDSVLIVEDDLAIAMGVQDRLTTEGYHAEYVADGDEGFRWAVSGAWDLLILDLMLPGRDGLSICRDLRARGVDAPILMLTARDDITDKIVGLKMGADDYLTKPFEVLELLARVEALLRRRSKARPTRTTYTVGTFELDLRRRELIGEGEPISLGMYEFKLLRYLCEHRGDVIDRDEILKSVWEYETAPFTRTVDLHIAYLRKKLGDSDRQELIVTVRGQGYKLAE